jgi:hypothetical protein
MNSHLYWFWFASKLYSCILAVFWHASTRNGTVSSLLVILSRAFVDPLLNGFVDRVAIFQWVIKHQEPQLCIDWNVRLKS